MRVVLANWIGARLRDLISAGQFQHDSFNADEHVALLAARLEWPGVQGVESFFNRAQKNTATFLDAIEVLLRTAPPARLGSWQSGARTSDLDLALTMAGSAWTVGPDLQSLTLRVDESAVAQAKGATGVPDGAQDDLVEAWNAAFGRRPNASDAWDHSIKAVEHVYSPLVLECQAANDKSTLGKVANELRDNRNGWLADIATERDDPTSGVAVIEAMMRTVWGNTDRHGGGPSWRPPKLSEAQAIVHAAITLVQWGRQGVLRKRGR